MIGAGIILLPFILHKMPQETVGIWNIFQTVTSLVLLLDFGFRPTFARNISYIFSGVKTIQKDGVQHTNADAIVHYELLKGTLTAMRRFYRWMSLAVFALLATFGTIYFHYILQKYSGDRQDAMIAWIILIVINCYNLYTFYYDALLTGKGYIKQIQQITILGQTVYLVLAITLIYCSFQLIAIVSAQLVYTVIRRIMMYHVFFTPSLKQHLSNVQPKPSKEILSAITPNAAKIGLTQLGGFLINKSAILIGSAFLTLDQVACYGITLQVMDILARCANVPYFSYMPKLAQCRAENNISQLKSYYIRCTVVLWIIFLIGGIFWVGLGNRVLDIIRSQTHFVPTAMLCVMLVVNALEQNHALSAGFILADNKTPFFIPSLVSGIVTVFLLWLFLCPLNMGLWGLILASGLAQLVYQNWKWPSVIIKELWTNS